MSRIAILEHGSVAINCDADPCECEKPSGQFKRLDGALDSTTALKWIAMKFEQWPVEQKETTDFACY